MGGMATAMNLRLEAGAERIQPVRILMLLDRQVDVFLARRSNADGWLVKPLDPIRLRKAAVAIMAGQRYEEPMTPGAPRTSPARGGGPG
jgi:DNA-binding response OmpR family regulator